LNNPLGRGHGGLQDVVLFAQVLDGAEEAGGVLQKRDHDPDGDSAALEAPSAVGEKSRDGERREEFDDRIEPAIGDDGVLEGEHVLAIDLVELLGAFFLAIE
jgi:hypothetical protein